MARRWGTMLTITLLGVSSLAPISGPVLAEPISEPIYGIQPPSADPARQQHIVDAGDGTAIFTETWLPVPKGGHEPPSRVPTIVSISPYLTEGEVESPFLLSTMVPRGYAYTNVHVRGTGRSGGCVDLFGPTEADDSARAVEYVGRDAPWSDGNVGGYGVSYPGGTLLSVAGRGDPSRAHYLKAIVSGAPYHSMHEARWMFDGVASFVVSNLTAPSYSAQSFGARFDAPPVPPPLERIPDRPGCLAAHNIHMLDTSGDHTPWHRERDNRAWTRNITAATLLFHGHADLVPTGGSPPSIEVGLFDHLPATTPHVGLFGVFGHQRPPRADFTDMMVAWFDRYLKSRDTGVETWPRVQVQGTDGVWSAASGWPATGGQAASLALGGGGTLDTAPSPPTTTTEYTEAFYETTVGMVPGTFATFETPPLPAGLELVGQPQLDLWVELSLPDAHIAARLDTFDSSGKLIANGSTYGLRSARHVGPLEDDRFVQEHGMAPPVDTPMLVPVRFQPTALVVPPEGKVRLTVAGSLIVNSGLAQVGIPEPLFRGPSQPSGLPTTVTILHDAAYPSALRFLRRP